MNVFIIITTEGKFNVRTVHGKGNERHVGMRRGSE